MRLHQINCLNVWMKSVNLEAVHTDQDLTCGTIPSKVIWLDDFYNKIKRLWFVQFQPWGAQSISQGYLSVQFEQSRHYTMSDWAVVKRRYQSLKLQPPVYQELSKDYRAKQGNRTVFVHQYKHWWKCLNQVIKTAHKNQWKEVPKA